MTATLRRAPAATTAARTIATGRRLRSLDVVRGIAIVGMILVNNQGSGDHAFWQLSHADWNGWSLADLVFPTFLFVVGGSMAASMARSRPSLMKVMRRAVLLFVIGFAMNALPPTVLHDVRVMGVLQRIAIVSLLASLVVLYLPERRQQIVAAAALVGYWVAVGLFPMTPDHSLPGMIDRALLGVPHVYKNGGYDPEGLLSSIPATVSALFGFWTVSWLRRQEPTTAISWKMARTGAVLVVAGQLWGFLFPINKRLWTSSYVVLAAGCGMLLLAVAHEVVEVRGGGRGSRAMEIFGRNALIVFIASEILTTQLKAHGWRPWLYQHLFSPYAGFLLGSLLYGLAMTAIWWVVAYGLWRRRIFVKL